MVNKYNYPILTFKLMLITRMDNIHLTGNVFVARIFCRYLLHYSIVPFNSHRTVLTLIISFLDLSKYPRLAYLVSKIRCLRHMAEETHLNYTS